MIVDLKRNLIGKSDSRSPADVIVQAQFVLEMAHLGYAVPLQSVQGATKTELTDVLKDTKVFKGADRNWTPFYPNFPQQVLDASDAELFINAMVHYIGIGWFGVDIRPDYPVAIREKLDVSPEHLQILEVASDDEILESKIKNLENKVSLSADDFAEINKAMKKYGEEKAVALVGSFNFHNKENWVSALGLMADNGVDSDKVFRSALSTAKSPTDLLRAIFMFYAPESNVHIDLTPKDKVVRLNPIPRSVRKAIVFEIAQRFSRHLDDFYMQRKLWKIVDRKIHPSEYNSDVVNAVFDVVRGNVSYQTFNSRWQTALRDKNSALLIATLSERPGVFARNLDFALRSFPRASAKKIAIAFGEVANKVSPIVLASLYNGLSNRGMSESVIRTKSGATTNVVNEKSEIDADVVESAKAAVLEGLRSNFKDYDALGKVFVSEELRKIPAPLQQRTVGAGRLLPRGSTVPMDVEDTLRFFVHWYNNDDNDWSGRIDVDMDAIFLNSSFGVVDYVSYTHLRNDYATHSGDITNAPRPNGAAEFVDINVQKALKSNVRYVVLNMNVYSGGKFSEVDNYAGFMLRKDAQKGEIFDPKTVNTAFTSTVPARNAIPAVFDLQEKQMTWLDTSYGQAGFGYSAYSGHNEVADTVKMELDKSFLSMYDVLVAHAETRGELVDSEDEAEVVFSKDTMDLMDSNGFISKFF